MLLATCSRWVFKAFRRVERCGDRLMGTAGPAFVALAVGLIAVCGATFFEVVFPYQFWQPDTPWVVTLAGAAWCTYLCYAFIFHYYMSVSVRPGTPRDPPFSSSAARRPLVALLPAALCVGPLRQWRSDAQRRAFIQGRVSHERRVASISASPLMSVGFSGGNAQKRSRDTDEEAPPSLAKHANGGGPRADRYARECKKCPPVMHPSSGRMGRPEKPERTHHCRVCGTCVLKFDHHCPWINQCVGHYNERYFLLFLLYFPLSCLHVVVWGWAPFMSTLDFTRNWDYFTPRTTMLALWVVCAVMAFAVGIMGLFQLFLISKGETAVESHDNDWYRKNAKARGKAYVNPYDLGSRSANLKLFFNLQPYGPYHWSTIFRPTPFPPHGDGRNWIKPDGWNAEGNGVEPGDELTDEEAYDSDEA